MIPRRAIDNMKCSLCHNALSIFPINSYGDKDMVICGRCPVQEDFLPQREHLYEELAQHLEFSCRFEESGCIEKMKPVDLKNHESTCPHRQCLCPILPLGECKWQGNYKDMYDHCEEVHPTMAFKNLEVEIDIIGSHKKNYVVMHANQTFVARLNCDLTARKIVWDVISCDVKSKTDKSSYCVSFTNNKSKQNVCPTRDVNYCNSFEFVDTEKATVLNIDDLLIELNNPTYIRCRVEILVLSSAKSTSNMMVDGNEMLASLECPICLEYMIPPIFLCNIGHSFCGSHRPQLTACPTCQGGIGESRNYLLEKITGIIPYPCKHSHLGCSFTSVAEKIKPHEAVCIYGPYRCFLPECQWKRPISELKRHLEDDHKESVVETTSITYFLDEEQFDECHYVIFLHDSIFQVRFSRFDDSFTWQLYLIGDSNDHTHYMLELDFTSKRKEKMYVTQICNKGTFDINTESEELTLSLDIINKFINDGDILSYKARVIRVE